LDGQKRRGDVVKSADKLQRAKIALVLDECFFGALLLGLKVVEDKAGTVTKTCATNGESLWWHGPFLDKLTERELKTILAHEALHAALLHPLRRGARDNGQWNIACDHAVNLHLEDCNAAARAAGKAEPFPWPELDIYKDPQFAGKSAEEIYNALAPQNQNQTGPGDDPESGGKGSPSDQQGMGGVLDAPGDEASQQEQEASWQVALVQAAQTAKQAGQLPAGMARLVQETINPPARWQDLLRAFITAKAHTDFSWTHPNTRYAHTGFILPSLHNQVLGTVVVAADCSGSMWTIAERVFSEIQSILDLCQPESLILTQFDTDIHSWDEVQRADTIPHEAHGGGGTSFTCVFSELEKRQIAPDCLIIITDGQGSFPKTAPDYPVLWALTEETKVPFGHSIKL
jgi:predicted metal-dependent peptidase